MALHVGNWELIEKLRNDAGYADEVRKRYLAKKKDLALEIVIESMGERLRSDRDRLRMARIIAKWFITWDTPPELAKQRAFDILEPDYQMQELVTNVSNIKQRLDKALEEQATDPTNDQMTRVVSMYQRMWMEARNRLSAVEKQTNTEKDRFLATGPWKQTKDRIFKRLIRDYKGRGEVYRSLCDRLASVQAALARLENEGRIETELYRDLTSSHTNIVAQIQRYTESMKTEIMETHVQEVGQSILQIIEPLLLNQPQLFDRIIDAIEANVDGLAEGKIKYLPERASA